MIVPTQSSCAATRACAHHATGEPLMITDELAIAISRFVEGPLGPTAVELSDLVERVGLSDHDPIWESDKAPAKAKRAQRILMQARTEAPEAGWRFIDRLFESLRARRSFQPRSENYPGATAVAALHDAFERIGYELSSAGDPQPLVFGRINPESSPEGVRLILERSRRNAGDPALLSAGAKELIEGVSRVNDGRI